MPEKGPAVPVGAGAVAVPEAVPEGVPPVAYLTRYWTPVAGQVDLVPSGVLLVSVNGEGPGIIGRWGSTWSCWDELAGLDTAENVVVVPDLLENAALASQCWDESVDSLECVLDLDKRVGGSGRWGNASVGENL